MYLNLTILSKFPFGKVSTSSHWQEEETSLFCWHHVPVTRNGNGAVKNSGFAQEQGRISHRFPTPALFPLAAFAVPTGSLGNFHGAHQGPQEQQQLEPVRGGWKPPQQNTELLRSQSTLHSLRVRSEATFPWKKKLRKDWAVSIMKFWRRTKVCVTEIWPLDLIFLV